MGASFSSIWTQFFPSKPTFTEANLPNLSGRVFVISGATSGVGADLARLLYAGGGTVYTMNRDDAHAEAVLASIRNNTSTTTPGSLHHIKFDLMDLSTVAPAAADFHLGSSRLDVLFNNAGVGSAPVGLKTAQGLDAHYGANAAGPHLLRKLLFPALARSAETAPPGSVRIVWTSSVLVDLMSPKNGIRLSQCREPGPDRNEHYAASRVGNGFLASEWDRRMTRKAGVVSVTQNPGNLLTNVWRTTQGLYYWPSRPLLHPSVNGAYVNLWAGLSEEVRLEDGGRYIIPRGRWHPGQREDIVRGLKSKIEGGTGVATEFWDWCEEMVKDFVPA